MQGDPTPEQVPADVPLHSLDSSYCMLRVAVAPVDAYGAHVHSVRFLVLFACIIL